MRLKLLLSTVFISTLLVTSCKKDDKTTTGSFDDRLEGTWMLASVNYYGEVADPSNVGSFVSFNGIGQNPSGQFVFTKNPDKVDYTMDFIVNMYFGVGDPINANFHREGLGDWEYKSSDAKLFIREQPDSLIWEIIEDSDNRQKWNTLINVTHFENDDTINIPVNLTAVFTK